MPGRCIRRVHRKTWPGSERTGVHRVSILVAGYIFQVGHWKISYPTVLAYKLILTHLPLRDEIYSPHPWAWAGLCLWQKWLCWSAWDLLLLEPSRHRVRKPRPPETATDRCSEWQLQLVQPVAGISCWIREQEVWYNKKYTWFCVQFLAWRS